MPSIKFEFEYELNRKWITDEETGEEIGETNFVVPGDWLYRLFNKYYASDCLSAWSFEDFLAVYEPETDGEFVYRQAIKDGVLIEDIGVVLYSNNTEDSTKNDKARTSEDAQLNDNNKLVEKVEILDSLAANHGIPDADDILVSMVSECNYNFPGFAQDIFDIWKKSSDKKSVEAMFYEFTGTEFINYLMICEDEILNNLKR